MSRTAIESYSQLLSRENITVNFSETAKTAYFNIETREITLPTYDFLNKESQQMLVSHEVAHAKFSKYSLEEFQKYTKEFGQLLNIVEDIYVESAIKRDYPGLREIFTSAYKSLYENDFFKLENRSADSFHFYDRLNLFFKIGHVFPVKFSQEEAEYVVRCYSLKSNADVIQLCRDMKKFQEEQNQNSNQDKISNNPDCEPDSSEIEESQNSNGTSSSESGDDDNLDQIGTNSNVNRDGDNFEEPNDETADEGSSSEINTSKSNGTPTQEEPNVGETMTNFEHALREAQEESEAESEQTSTFSSYGCVTADLDILTSNNSDYAEDGIPVTESVLSFLFNKKDKRYERFIKKMNSEIAAIKRISKDGDNYFQMLRNAKKAKNVKYRNTGSIDARRLAKYKTSEAIFKRRAIVDNETNHGVVLFLDYSTSILSDLNDVISQAIITCEFCKRNGIKFEVYLFGGYNTHSGRTAVNSCSVVKIADTEHYMPEYLFAYSNTFYDFWTKTMKKDARDELKWSFYRPGKTPLMRCAFIAHNSVARLKSHGCDKTHIIFVTDGENTDNYCKLSWRSTDEKMNTDAMKRASFDSDGEFPIMTICECMVNNGRRSTITVNGTQFDAIKDSIFADSIFNSVLLYTKMLFNTEITFSFITDPTINTYGISVTNMVRSIINPKINGTQFTVNDVTVMNSTTEQFADYLILYCKGRNKSKAENNPLKAAYQASRVLSVFVKELAKNIA